MSETPETRVEESDPNADSHDGLSGGPTGGMGVSSERRGTVRGGDEQVTYTSAPVQPDDEADDEPAETPPEQSSADGRPEVNPSSPGRHESDPADHPGHGI